MLRFVLAALLTIVSLAASAQDYRWPPASQTYPALVNVISTNSYTASNALDCPSYAVAPTVVEKFTYSSGPTTFTIPTGLTANCALDLINQSGQSIFITQGSGFTLTSQPGLTGSNVTLQPGAMGIVYITSSSTGSASGSLVVGAYNVNNPCANYNGSVTTSNSCTLPMGVTGGDTVVVIVYNFGTVSEATVTVTDDKSDTCTQENTVGPGGLGNRYWSFVCPNVTSGATNFSVAFATATQSKIAAAEFGGVATSPLDGNAMALQNSPGSGTDALSSGNITTTVAGDLIVGWCAGSGGTQTIVNGTNYTAVLGNGSTPVMEYQTQASAGTVAATCTSTGTPVTDSATAVVALKHR